MLMKLARRTTVALFGVEIDVLDMQGAVDRVGDWVDGREGEGVEAGVDRGGDDNDDATNSTCRYVVTPNVDHVVMLQEHQGLRDAYRDASLVLADGHPVVWSSRWLRKPLPERVPGSDLVPRLFDAACSERPLRVFLLGAAPGVGQRAAERIAERWPAVEVVDVYSPPLGFEKDDQENELILAKVAAAGADLLVVGLGAPKQELWVHRHHRRLEVKVALCVGATIDFLAGEKARAPRWIQRLGLEWLHRVCSEPRRLFKRYFRDACLFPRIVLKEWRSPTEPTR